MNSSLNSPLFYFFVYGTYPPIATQPPLLVPCIGRYHQSELRAQMTQKIWREERGAKNFEKPTSQPRAKQQAKDNVNNLEYVMNAPMVCK